MYLNVGDRGKVAYDPQSFSLSSLTVHTVSKCMMPSVFKSLKSISLLMDLFIIQTLHKTIINEL